MLVDPETNHNSSEDMTFHASFLVVTAGKPSAILYLVFRPNTEIVPTPVLSPRTVPLSKIVWSCSRYTCINDESLLAALAIAAA